MEVRCGHRSQEIISVVGRKSTDSGTVYVKFDIRKSKANGSFLLEEGWIIDSIGDGFTHHLTPTSGSEESNLTCTEAGSTPGPVYLHCVKTPSGPFDLVELRCQIDPR